MYLLQVYLDISRDYNASWGEEGFRVLGHDMTMHPGVKSTKMWCGSEGHAVPDTVLTDKRSKAILPSSVCLRCGVRGSSVYLRCGERGSSVCLRRGVRGSSVCLRSGVRGSTVCFEVRGEGQHCVFEVWGEGWHPHTMSPQRPRGYGTYDSSQLPSHAHTRPSRKYNTHGMPISGGWVATAKS